MIHTYKRNDNFRGTDLSNNPIAEEYSNFNYDNPYFYEENNNFSYDDYR